MATQLISSSSPMELYAGSKFAEFLGMQILKP